MGGTTGEQCAENSTREWNMEISLVNGMAGECASERTASLREQCGEQLGPHVAPTTATETSREERSQGESRSTTARVGYCTFQARAPLRQPQVIFEFRIQLLVLLQ